jgi:hypothetical protein
MNARTGQRTDKARITSTKYLLLEILPQRNIFLSITPIKGVSFHLSACGREQAFCRATLAKVRDKILFMAEILKRLHF